MINVMSQLNYLDWIIEKWFEKSSLLVSLPAALIGGYLITDFIFKESNIKLIDDYFWYIKTGVGILFLFITFSTWLYSRKYPKTKKDEIGIVVVLRDNSVDAKTVKNDVQDKFREIIKDLPIDNKIKLIVLKDFLARNVIDTETAIKVSNKTRGHFVVWGKALSYKFNEASNQYEFDLSFVVRHRPLSSKEKNIIVRGFQESFVDRKWRFLQSDILNGIRTTADNIKEIALYIIGIAAFLSFDFRTSVNFHSILYDILLKNPDKRKILSPIYKRTKDFISDSLMIMGLENYHNTGDTKYAITLTEKSLELLPTNYAALVNKALYFFKNKRIDESREIIRKLKKMNSAHPFKDSSWRYSDGFLLFFEEDFENGVNAYKKGLDGYITDFTLNSVINFTENFVKENPNKVQFFYVLGIIYLIKNQNLPEALKNFEEFVKQADKNPKYRILAERANSYLGQIRNRMGIKKDGKPQETAKI